MGCAESLELEKIWKKHYDLATRTEEGGGLFAVTQAKSSHALLVRQNRAKQAQAANAIMMHRRNCSICSDGRQGFEEQTLAS